MSNANTNNQSGLVEQGKNCAARFFVFSESNEVSNKN